MAKKKSKVSLVRDKSGKIKEYRFSIGSTTPDPVEGCLTREEMELIYRLYSSEGAELTMRQVSRYFPQFTFQQFKKVLRAFSITKAVAPFAPHQLEEKSTEELIQLHMQLKENDFLKKFEHRREDLFMKQYKDLLKEYVDFKKNISDFTEVICDVEFNLERRIPEGPSDKFMCVYLSDMHIGADVSPYSLYPNNYSKEVVMARMQKLLDYILFLSDRYGINNIAIFNLGDSLDGFDNSTARGGHFLPQNLTNKDQYKVFFSVMMDLFKNLLECGKFKDIQYIAVGSSNHGGDSEYVANKALEAGLTYMSKDIKVTIFDKIMDHIKIGDYVFIVHHGKDNKDMKYGLPLSLDYKTEIYINKYIDYHKLTGNISFVKGDLHESATTYGNKFRYKSVGSFFGSSEWIQANFPGTEAVVDLDILDNDLILETNLILESRC